MLGSMVYRYLSEKMPGKVIGWSRKNLDAGEFIDRPFQLPADLPDSYIVNCIGVVNKNGNVVGMTMVNAIFPHYLAAATKANIIHPSTDCVFSGRNAPYTDFALPDATDNYGKSKALGESPASNVLNIRASLIGPGGGLLQWFLDTKEPVVDGWANYLWNGVTTLQFAQLCEKIISRNLFDTFRKVGTAFHFAPNETVSKDTLLRLINMVFKCDKGIRACELPVINRTLMMHPELEDGLKKIPIVYALCALKEYMDDSRSRSSLQTDSLPGA
jgi:dTDP-4-dehydrorhamnose reductase